MEIRFNVIKEERKALVSAVSELTGCGAVYKGAPSFAFAVDKYIIDKNGTIIYDEQTDATEIRTLLLALTERGYIFEGDINEILPTASEQDEPDILASESGEDANDVNERNPQNAETFVKTLLSEALDKLVIEVPFEGFNPTALDNLDKLVDGKSALIMKAIGADDLPIERTESTLRFPWFTLSASPEEIDAYNRFICSLCDMAKKQKRVTMKETAVDSDNSEKFAFRCFLLRLGFIGDDCKAARKILLSKLSGNGSFKSGGHKREVVQEAVTTADSGIENAEAVNVCEDENDANNMGTGGEEGAYAYNPNLSDYDALMTRGENQDDEQY